MMITTAPLSRQAKASHKREVEILTWYWSHIWIEARLTRAGKLTPTACEQPLYQSSLEALRERTRNGWTDDQIGKHFEQAYADGIRNISLWDLLPASPPDWADSNLLPRSPSHRHAQLWEFSPPLCDEEGEVVNSGGTVLKEKYSLRDVANYYLDTLSPYTLSAEELLKPLKYLLNIATLDSLLFAIDLYGEEEGDKETPFALRKYIKAAQEEVAWREGYIEAPAR